MRSTPRTRWSKAQIVGTCLGLNGVRCYSADPNAYALMGLEDGLEILGTGAIADGR